MDIPESKLEQATTGCYGLYVLVSDSAPPATPPAWVRTAVSPSLPMASPTPSWPWTPSPAPWPWAQGWLHSPQAWPWCCSLAAPTKSIDLPA